MAADRGKTLNNVRETWERNEREDGVQRLSAEERDLEQTISEEASAYDADHTVKKDDEGDDAAGT